MHVWVERIARIGYAAYGTVYIVVGFFGLERTVGERGRVNGTQGALLEVLLEPYGGYILVALAGGLFCYALWRFVQAIHNPERENLISRIGNLSSGVVYGSLALFAFRALKGSRRIDHQAEESTTAQAMSVPYGEALVFLVALIFLGVAAYQFFESFTARFRKKIKSVGSSARKWIVRVASFGIAVRGVVFAMIGIFLFEAAMESNPAKAAGLDEVLHSIANRGSWLFYTVSAGFICYGIFGLIQSRYRRIYVTS